MNLKSEPNVQEQTGGAARAERSSSAGRKILLVDDEAERRKERIALLRQHGFMVYPALDLQQAATRCKRGAYDVIVVNGTGNIQGACTVCDQILKNDPQQPLLMMTGGAKASDRDYAVSSDPEELLRTVETLFHQGIDSQPVTA